MKNINIERYDHPSITRAWSGLIEGERADGSTWILFLNAEGSPALFWGERDAAGATIGDPVVLSEVSGYSDSSAH